MLAAISQVIERIALDLPGAHSRQGNTLGTENKNWFRAKFLQQCCLFFRCGNQRKTIVVTWINDEKTKRAYGSKIDAYRVFENMFDSGHPAADWETLLAEANKSGIKPPAKTLKPDI